MCLLANQACQNDSVQVAQQVHVDNAGRVIATITHADGTVLHQVFGQETTEPVHDGMALHAGDVIITQQDGHVTLDFGGKNTVILPPETTLLVQEGDPSKPLSTSALLLRGNARTRSGGEGIVFEILTPQSRTVLNGKHVGVVDVSTLKGVQVQIGEAEVKRGQETQAVHLSQGQSVSIEGLSIAKQQPTNVDGLAVWKQVATVSGLSLSGAQAAKISGLTVEQQNTSVTGLHVDKQNTQVQGLDVDKQSETISGVAVTPPDDKLNLQGTQIQRGIVVRASAGLRQADVKISASEQMQPLTHLTRLRPGGQVQVHNQGRAHVQIGSDGRVELGPKASFQYKSARQLKDGLQATYRLEHGGAEVLVWPRKGDTSQHHVQLQDGFLDAIPSVQRANLVFTPRGSTTDVYVRYGHMRLHHDEPIEAGQIVSIQKGHVVSEPTPLNAPIHIGASENLEILTNNKAMPAVGFQDQADANAILVQFSGSRGFENILAEEQVHRASFGIDKLPAKALYYRLNQNNKTIGSILVRPEHEDACPTCRHDNRIYDSGKNAVLFFQETLPEVTLCWASVENAKSYRLQLYQDSAYDKPIVDVKMTSNKKEYSVGKLKEGTYFWLVTATNNAGRVLSKSQSNLLNVRYDNVIRNLSVRYPAENIAVNVENIKTNGYVVKGDKILINGEAVEVTSEGYFEKDVDLKPGNNTIVYTVVHPNGLKGYYHRVVSYSAK